MIVDGRLCNRAGTHCCHKMIAPRPARARHHKIKSTVRCRRDSLRRTPVGHQQAVPVPLSLQHPVVQLAVLGGSDPIDVVVGGHDRPRIRIGYADLERQQVKLA